MDAGSLVATFSTVIEAELCRAALDAAEIPAWIAGDYLATAHPALGMSIGVRVLVPPVFEEVAREVLSGSPSRFERGGDDPEAA